MDRDIKQHISNKRKELSLTQKDVAQKIGISLKSYRALETGKTQILNKKISKIAESLGTSPVELVLGYKPSSENKNQLEELEANYKNNLDDIKKMYEEQISRLEDKINDLYQIIEQQKELILTKDQIINFLKS